MSADQLEETERSYIAEVIKEQEDAGLDLVTDGQVYWYDVVAHPASRLDGTETRGIVRFFDTNTYVRQPEVTGPIAGTFGLAADYARSKTSCDEGSQGRRHRSVHARAALDPRERQRRPLPYGDGVRRSSRT